MFRFVNLSQATVRRMASQLVLASALVILVAMSLLNASAQQTEDSNQGKHLDIRSSAGDLHVGNDADARDVGLPVYPGARIKHDDHDKNSANFAIFTAAFGMKLVVVNYESGDAPAKVIAYYRDSLKKFGKVLECRTTEHGGDIHVNAGKNNSNGSKEVQCESDNTGNIIELKVGTQDHQRLVSIEPAEKGNGSTFALVFVHTRGKQGDI